MKPPLTKLKRAAAVATTKLQKSLDLIQALNRPDAGGEMRAAAIEAATALHQGILERYVRATKALTERTSP